MKKNYFISIFFTAISVFILSYTFYYSEIKFESTRQEFYFKYYLLSLIFLCFSISSFFFSKDWIEKIFLIFVSVFFTFYILELYLLLKYKSKFDFNNYNIRKEYNENKKINKKITIAMLPRQINKNLYSFAGISKKETIYCNEHGYFTKFKSDRYGFNNEDINWDYENIDYVMVGDSFLLGSCVEKEDTITGNLVKISGSSKVLNLGYSGNGPLIEYATLREFLPLVSAKYVIWIYYEGNDFFELKKRLNNKFLTQYINNYDFKQNIAEKQNIIDKHLEKRVFNFAKQKPNENINMNILTIKQFLKLYKLRTFFFEPLFTKSNYKEFEKIISDTKKFVYQNNANLIFVYIPTYEYLVSPKISRHKKNYKKVLEIIGSHKIKFVDMYPKFKSINNPLKLYPFKDDGHLDGFGYKIVADSIIKAVNQ